MHFIDHKLASNLMGPVVVSQGWATSADGTVVPEVTGRRDIAGREGLHDGIKIYACDT